jgi:hypothetical protein
VDDRRVISGIVHMLKSGAALARLPAGVRAVHDGLQPLQPLQPLEPARHLDEDVKALTGHTGIWTGDVAIDATSIKAHRSAAGAKGGLPPKHRPLPRRIVGRDRDFNGRCPIGECDFALNIFWTIETSPSPVASDHQQLFRAQPRWRPITLSRPQTG